MYVCVCQGIRCRDVKDAAGKGASRPADVFRHAGCKPQCGRCLPHMREMLDERPETPAGPMVMLAAE